MNAREASMHRVPALYDVEAEQALIGSVLSDNGAYWRVHDRVTPEDFYDALHGRLWAKIAELVAKDRRANAVTLTAAMGADPGLLDPDIGPDYVRSLSGAAPAMGPVKEYAATIADFGRRRRIIRAADDAIFDAYNDREASPETIADRLGEQVHAAAHANDGVGPEPIIDIARRAAQAAEDARLKPDKSRITTGLSCIDHRLGGLFPGKLHVLGAQSSMGKSALLAQMAKSAAVAGYVVLIFSVEMASDEMATRYLAADASVPANRIEEGRTTQQEIQKIAEATTAYSDLRLFIDGTSDLSVAQMRARCQAIRRKHGALDLVCVDHLRLVRAANPRDQERERLDQVTKDVKAIAKDFRLAALLVAPLNRDNKNRSSMRPVVSDIYGSSAIEYNADHVWFLYREDFALEHNRPDDSNVKALTEWQTKLEAARGWAEVFSDKRRSGPIGSARLKFHGPSTRFIDPDADAPSAQEMML